MMRKRSMVGTMVQNCNALEGGVVRNRKTICSTFYFKFILNSSRIAKSIYRGEYLMPNLWICSTVPTHHTAYSLHSLLSWREFIYNCTIHFHELLNVILFYFVIYCTKKNKTYCMIRYFVSLLLQLSFI